MRYKTVVKILSSILLAGIVTVFWHIDTRLGIFFLTYLLIK